jgi:uncharacterized protein (TIGR02611 family)
MPGRPAGDAPRARRERAAGTPEPGNLDAGARGAGGSEGEDVEAVDAAEAAVPPDPEAALRNPLRARLISVRRRMQATPAGRATFRILVALLGGVVVVVGLALVPLPGPGWFIVFAGLAIWAIEFVWARHLLRLALRLLHGWRAWLARRHWLIRLPLIGAILLVVLVVVWLSVRLAFGYDPVEDVFGWRYGAPAG